jgi:hypothetical protein
MAQNTVARVVTPRQMRGVAVAAWAPFQTGKTVTTIVEA